MLSCFPDCRVGLLTAFCFLLSSILWCTFAWFYLGWCYQRQNSLCCNSTHSLSIYIHIYILPIWSIDTHSYSLRAANQNRCVSRLSPSPQHWTTMAAPSKWHTDDLPENCHCHGRTSVMFDVNIHKHPAGLVSAHAVEHILERLRCSMMRNVRCVTVFCIDMQGLSQHSVHENNSKIVAILTSKCYETVVSCEKKRALFLPPASSSDQSLLDNFWPSFVRRSSLFWCQRHCHCRMNFMMFGFIPSPSRERKLVGTDSLHKRHIPSMAPVWMSSSPDRNLFFTQNTPWSDCKIRGADHSLNIFGSMKGNHPSESLFVSLPSHGRWSGQKLWFPRFGSCFLEEAFLTSETKRSPWSTHRTGLCPKRRLVAETCRRLGSTE